MSIFSTRPSFKNLTVKIVTIFFAFWSFQNIAYAQFKTDSDEFLTAVKDSEGSEAEKYIDRGLINTKQRITGLTALHLVVERRDTLWLTYLLQKKARPDVKDKEGISPLIRAVELNFIEGVEKLLTYKASVDYPNRSGETALIKAVNLGRVDIIPILLKAGADPDRTDVIQGFSAREYATRDPRKQRLLSIIENYEEEKKKEAEGKKPSDNQELDFSGFSGPKAE